MLQSGQLEGLSIAYDRYSKVMFGLILKVVKKPELAEEVLQDSFLKVWEKSSLYDPEKGKFLTWMLNIGRNTAIDRIRLKRYSRENEPLDTAEPVMIQPSLNPETIGVKDMVDQLSEEHRDIIELIYYQGYSQSETAKELGIPLGTVKSRLYKAIGQLSNFFSRE